MIGVGALPDQALCGNDERWCTLLAHVSDMVVLVSAAGVITCASDSVRRSLGYNRDELIGRNLTFASDPDDVDELAKALREAKPGHPVCLTRRVRARDGSHRLCESRVACIGDGLWGTHLVISSDVTDRERLKKEEDRLELDRRVAHRLEAVGQLAAGIAHEINTPLQYVGDSVTFLKEAVEELVMLTGLYRGALFGPGSIPVDERRRAMRHAEDAADVDDLCERIPKAFERTETGIERVRTIVQAMKRFSHDSGADPAPADLNEAIATTLAVCRNEYKYVADTVVDLGNLPLVTCNAGELNQVFLNLIINAAQAIADKVGDTGKRGSIKIATRVESSHVVIEIADDGPGIPADIQERIYDPFFTTKVIGRGSGQGLALARTTVARHGGSLDCVSNAGEGATFTIRLPVADVTQGKRQV